MSSALRATADLQRASLSVDALNFAKAAGEPAKLAVDLAFKKGAVEVRDFALTNDFGAEPPVVEAEASGAAGAAPKKLTPIAVFGTARFGAHGYIETVNLPRVQLGEDSNFAVEAKRADSGILELTLTGESIDLSGLITSAVEAGPRSDERSEFGWGAAVDRRGVRFAIHGVRAAAIHHGHLRGEIQPIAHHADGSQYMATIVDPLCYVSAPFSGHYEEHMPCGAEVKPGDIVGYLHDFERIDERPWPVRAQVAGRIVGQAWEARVQQGQHILAVGQVIG